MTVSEWLAQRTRVRFLQLSTELRPMRMPDALAHLAMHTAQLQARCDLLEQAVDGIVKESHGIETLPVGAVRH